ncbi:MAG: hypothetical protein CL424_17235 [Acidimicrobiaceae bacterium]|nr:hypothetical protein [Acidimicrobiaceae bacterium]
MRPRPLVVVTAAIVAVSLVVAGCSGDDEAGADVPGADALAENDALCLDGDRADDPVIGWVEPAIELAVDRYGDPTFFEISADRQRVSVIVAVDGTAEQLFYCGAAGYVPPSSLGEADGATFGPTAVDFDPDRIFDQLDEELDEPDIGDFAIVGDGAGGVAYDATVQSDAGGVLLVRLDADGSVLGVQAQ